MEVKLFIKAPPFSVNRLYYANKFTRTREAREWGNKIFESLNEEYNQSQIKIFQKEFVKDRDVALIWLTYWQPKSKFFTKAGTVSRFSMDLTNVEKPLVDLLCDAKYSIRECPEGAPNLRIDDKNIVNCNSYKLPWDQDGFMIEVIIKKILLKDKGSIRN